MAEIDPADDAVGRRADRLFATGSPYRATLGPGARSARPGSTVATRSPRRRRPEPAPRRPARGASRAKAPRRPRRAPRSPGTARSVSIGREVVPERHGAGHRGDHDHVRRPGDEQRRGSGGGGATRARVTSIDARRGAQHRRVAQMEPRGRLVERREVDRHEQLDRVEPETHQDAGQRLPPRQELEAVSRSAPEELPGEERQRDAQRGVGRLLGRDPPNRPDRPPPGGAAEPPERIDVQEEQDDGAMIVIDLDRSAARWATTDAPSSQRRLAPRRVGRANVGKHGQQEEQAREDIPPLRRPRDGLDAQGMEREEHGRRAAAPVVAAVPARAARAAAISSPRDGVEGEGRRDVDQKAGQMVAGGFIPQTT